MQEKKVENTKCVANRHANAEEVYGRWDEDFDARNFIASY